MFDATKVPLSMYSLIVQVEPQALLESSWICKPVCSVNVVGPEHVLTFGFDTTTVPFNVIES